MAMTNLLPWRWGEKQIPVKREPVPDLPYNFNHLVDAFFNDDVFNNRFGLATSFDGFHPHIDVSENDRAITVSAELPGMDENDIEVSLAQQTLTISGEKKAEKENRRENYYYLERSYGSFRRSIALPAEVEPEQVKATFRKGVLTVTLPKTAEAQKQRKKITVTTQ